METKIENINSTKDEKDQAILEDTDLELTPEEGEETEDVEVLKERLNKALGANKQLFYRTKKAEGFEMKDGVWVKKASKPAEVKVHTETEEGDVNVRITNGIKEALEQRDLDSLAVSDNLKAEISNYAKLKGLSVLQANDSTYIKFLKEEEVKEKNGYQGSMPEGSRGTFTNNKRKPIDPRTEDGKKAIAKRDEELRKKLG